MALTTYNNALTKIVASRDSVVNTTFSQWQSDINSAISKAKSDCSSGVDTNTAYNTFAAAITSANNAVATNSKMADLKTQIDPINQQLSQSITSAGNAFKAAITPVWNALTTAFGVVATPATH